MTEFVLDPRLAADSEHLATIRGVQARMMNDARFPWMILVPEHAGASELFDLPQAEETNFMDVICRVGAAMKAEYTAEKMNIAQLGNVVTQLHVHVIARWMSDLAGAAPIWGVGKPEPMTDAQMAERRQAFQRVLATLS